jgi:O-antigen/teichoic acid export membrane protein
MASLNISKKQNTSGTLRRITVNFTWFLSGELTAKFLGYLAIVMLARKLGADGFGSLGFAEAFFSYFIYIGIAGVDTIATRSIARNKDIGDDYISGVVSLKLLLCFVAYAMLAALAFSVGIAPRLKYLTLLYGLCLLPIALSTEWLFQGLEKMKYIGLFRVLRETVFVSEIFLILFLSGSLYYIPAARVAAMTVAVIFLFLIVHRLGLKISLKINLLLWKRLLMQSYPLLASQLLIILIYNFAILVLGSLGKTEEIGYFSAIQKIVLFVFGLAGVFWSVIFPNTSRSYSCSHEQYCRLQEMIARAVTLFAAPLAIIGYMLADKIVPFIYGPSYIQSIPVFKTLIWVAAIGFINGIFAQGLLACDRQNLFFIVVLIQTLIVVALVLFLTPRFGAVGASFSWLAAEFCGFFLYKTFHNKTINFPFYRYLIKPTAAALVVFFMLQYFDQLHVLVALILSGIVYIFILLILQAIKIKELKDLYQIIVTK